MRLRLPRPRLTIRRLMIAVAVVAVGLGTGRWYHRRFTPWWRYQQSLKSLTGDRQSWFYVPPDFYQSE